MAATKGYSTGKNEKIKDDEKCRKIKKYLQKRKKKIKKSVEKMRHLVGIKRIKIENYFLVEQNGEKQ